LDNNPVGMRGMSMPSGCNISKTHFDTAIQNNYYFIKDKSKMGTYIRIGKKDRVELHKGYTFAVGKAWFKVSAFEGDAYDNKEAKAQAEKDQKAKAAKKEANPDQKEEEHLDDGEEYADTDDEGDGAVGKYDGPPVMVLSSVDKKMGIKGRIRETQTIGAGDSNKIIIPKEQAAKRAVQDVHARVVLEEGKFFLEHAAGPCAFGTYIGVSKKFWCQVNGGDELLLGGARFSVSQSPATLQIVQGIMDMLIGEFGRRDYRVKLLKNCPVSERISAMHAGPI